MKTNKCKWCLGNSLMEAYHDQEWGVPLHDDRKLFEFLVLDAFQAGLSWQTIINKRDNFCKAFDDFDYQKIACYDQNKIDALLNDSGIIRNKLKVYAAVNNARLFMDIQQEFGSFDTYIWQFTGGSTRINAWTKMEQIPAKTAESDAMSKDLKRRGFKFVGSTICYAFMQAAGMVNDHEIDCFRYFEVDKLSE
ncbi:MAG: DNA-3-methyladenine glycosylase I [Bacteroidetes bacterium]|nr:DNA-3-methyladenine glycosylase I [Bacteroidota bacterium]MBT7826108.1 DNA-3-methyladenine glycosylase I [Bacteroidota bacterium]